MKIASERMMGRGRAKKQIKPNVNPAGSQWPILDVRVVPVIANRIANPNPLI